MNKSDLIKHVSSETGISQAQAEKAINSFMSCVTQSLSTGETVTLIGFGSFSVTDRAARNGRHPQTGEILKIAAKKIPKFSAGKALKEAVVTTAKKAKKTKK